MRTSKESIAAEHSHVLACQLLLTVPDTKEGAPHKGRARAEAAVPGELCLFLKASGSLRPAHGAFSRLQQLTPSSPSAGHRAPAHSTSSAKTHTHTLLLKSRQPFKQLTVTTLAGLWCTRSVRARSSCSRDSHGWQWSQRRENWTNVEASQNKPALMRCHLISHISS